MSGSPNATSAGGPRQMARSAMLPGFSNIQRAAAPRATFVRLASYFAPFKAQLVLVTVCVVLYTLLGLAGPYLMGRGIDDFIAKKDPVGLGRIALLMLGAYVLMNGLIAASNWIMAGLSQRALREVRRDLFEHLQRLPLSFYDRQSAGELMSRLTNDVDAINQAVAQNVTSLLASVLSMVGIVVAMFVLNVWLALASLVVVPIMFWFTRFVAVYTRRGFKDLQKNLGELNGVMEEAIAAQRVVKVFRRGDAVIGAFRERNEEVYKAGVRANSYALLLMPLTWVLGNLFVIVLSGLGGFLALAGLTTVGVIATFINYGQSFINPLRQLSNLYNAIQAALAGAERVLQIIDSPSEVDADKSQRAQGPTRGHVVFDHVSFGYRSDSPVIKDMSLTVQPGEMVALVGATGAGKTTIVQLLTRFYEIERGTISIDGVDVRRIQKSDLRKRLGLVLQDTYLFATTVMENIRYGRLDATDEEVMAAAVMADADHFIRQLPNGYRTVLTERAGNLSQGQRQLLAIARTLLADPSILILDEATSSVDTRTEVRIQRALLRLMKGRTSFVIAHRLSTIRDADQVIVIDQGEIVERGSHAELLSRRGVFYRLHQLQFKGQAI